MKEFYQGCAKIMAVCFVLFLSFLISTIAFDSLAKAVGLYDGGIREEQELFQ